MWGLRGHRETPVFRKSFNVFQIQWMRGRDFFYPPQLPTCIWLVVHVFLSWGGWIWIKLTAPPDSILKALFNFDSCAQIFGVIFSQSLGKQETRKSLLETSMTCLRGCGDLGEDSHREEGERKSEKEGRDAAWGPKQETDDIYIYIYICGRRSREVWAEEWGRKTIRIRIEEVKLIP